MTPVVSEDQGKGDLPVLEVSALDFSYSAGLTKTPVVQGLSLKIFPSEIVTILGASGCGKTTLLNLIAGLIAPIQGSIKVTANSGERGRIGYIFQQDALFPWRTVRDNILLALHLDPSRKKDVSESRMNTYLETFHLPQSVLAKYPSQLSGGMRQRVSIIQSLMFEPELLLLDEPFSALDFYTKLRLEAEFYQLIKREKRAAILVTHDIDEAIALSDRVLIMDRSGNFTENFSINLGSSRDPEQARGAPEFSSYYQKIWKELKAVIQE